MADAAAGPLCSTEESNDAIRNFRGVDWSTQTHQIAVVDADGLAEMAEWILGHGPEVGALLERSVAVFALNPKQFDRFRDRLSPAGAKDALVLVNSLATNRKTLREVETPSAKRVLLGRRHPTGLSASEELAVLSDGVSWIRTVCAEILSGRNMASIFFDLFHALEYAVAVQATTPDKGERKT